MKKIIFIVLMIIFFCPNVYAAEFNLNSYISATYSGTRSKYECYETYEYGSISHCVFGTRYSGRMGSLKIFIHYPFEEDTNYRLTFNMATDDFRNNFGSAWTWDCDNNTDITNMNSTVWVPTFISYKKAQLSFSLNANTTCVGVLIRSANYSSDAFTGVNNWNLSNITIYDPDWQSGGSGQGTATPSPTTPDPNQQIIDNANQNTQDVIENNNSNTQQIIDNQNELLGDKCSNLFGNYDILNGYIYDVRMSIRDAASDRLALIPCKANTTYTITRQTITSSFRVSDYSGSSIPTMTSSYVDYAVPRVIENNSGTSITYTTSSNAKYLVIHYGNVINDTSTQLSNTLSTMMVNEGSSSKPYCEFGSFTSKLDNVNNSITNDNIDSGTGSDFFDSFTNNMHGLSSIITIPLSTIQSLTNAQCTPLTLPIPFTNKNITLPCMTEIYQQHVPLLLSLLRTCWLGIISYKALIDIFAMVKGFKDPDSDKIEVMEL